MPIPCPHQPSPDTYWHHIGTLERASPLTFLVANGKAAAGRQLHSSHSMSRGVSFQLEVSVPLSWGPQNKYYSILGCPEIHRV